MQFSMLLTTLQRPLQQISGIAVAGPNKDDITQNLLLSVKNGMLTLTAMDYSIEMSVSLPISDVASEGETTVNAATLRETCKHLDDKSLVKFDYDADKELLTLSSGTTSFTIRTRNAAEFPVFETEEVEQKIVLKQKQLKNLIDSSLFCVSNEDFREYLRGVRFEAEQDNLTVFTSDGHRMAILDTKTESTCDTPFGAIMTRRCASELAKIVNSNDDPIELNFSRNSVTTLCNSFSLKSKLIICNYPNVRSVIPSKIDTSIAAARDELRSKIAGVAVMSTKRVNGVTMTFADNQLLLHSENSEHEMGTSSMPIDYSGSPIEITFNATYLIEILSGLSSNQAVFNFSHPLSNTLISSDQPENDCGIKARYLVSQVVV